MAIKSSDEIHKQGIEQGLQYVVLTHCKHLVNSRRVLTRIEFIIKICG